MLLWILKKVVPWTIIFINNYGIKGLIFLKTEAMVIRIEYDVVIINVIQYSPTEIEI